MNDTFLLEADRVLRIKSAVSGNTRGGMVDGGIEDILFGENEECGREMGKMKRLGLNLGCCRSPNPTI